MLTVKAIHLEPGVRADDRLALAVAGALRDLCEFLGGREVSLLACDPPAFAPLLKAALDAGTHGRQP